MKKIRVILCVVSLLLIVAANLSLVLFHVKMDLPMNANFFCTLVFLNIGLLASAGFLFYGTGKDKETQNIIVIMIILEKIKIKLLMPLHFYMCPMHI